MVKKENLNFKSKHMKELFMAIMVNTRALKLNCTSNNTKKQYLKVVFINE